MKESAAELESILQQRFFLTPVVATEIEFYLDHADDASAAQIATHLNDQCANANILLLKWEKEKGEAQYEVALSPMRSVVECIDQTNALKQALERAALAAGAEVNFAARPYPAQPGSGLHVHVHLENEAGQSVYFKRDEQMSDELRWSIGGLLATMREMMIYFAPNEDSYARFTPGSNAPTTVSWGANNRTTAIRLPDIGAPHRHIEHRVAGADAKVENVIKAILKGIIDGLQREIEPAAQVYGDASLEMYDLPKLPVSLEEAQSLCHPRA